MKSRLIIGNLLNTAGLMLLITLWTYAFFIKIIDFNHYQNQMADQPFPIFFQGILTYGLLITEALAAILLIIGKKLSGLILSLMLLIAFTIYILLILNGAFPERPCSCGGFISKMSWKNHLKFNLVLIAINSFCLYTMSKKGRRLAVTA
ncbi:MAG: hypothetical protein EOO20_18410 [Chryseobacterium sp.]|nr:MAG: hypothetical protein EOO20_18410 [Chryseobacterium sp.]